MASTAGDLRDQIAAALDAEAGEGPFSRLLSEVRAQLVSDVDGPRFADMCAQTLTYGVLSSRVTDPEGFGSSPVFSSVPLANPFLESFFEQVHDQAVALDIPGSGLPQLVADLRETNVEAILDQFGATAKGGDPVVHFYEEFLKRYDAKMRADAGAFYTPQPVVEFMVRMVDEVLRSRFGLPLGIADPATWAEVADRNGFEVPEGVDPHKPFVSMIDPATGTGTFLIEWLRRARESYTGGAETANAAARLPLGDGPLRPEASHTAMPLRDSWPEHLRSHVLPAMHAFENMLAPYTIAHLKVALELQAAIADRGDSDGAPARILLTDALDHRAPQQQFGTMADPVAAEGERAAHLKESERFTVVIGNPPYDREQRSAGDAGDTGRRKGGVVRYGAPGVVTRGLAQGLGSRGWRSRSDELVPLLSDITEPKRAAKRGHHLKNVYNDYVYFWRWAVWQATELPRGPGVVAFITASSYLDGVSMGGLRALLRDAFDELWIIDLGGEGRGAQTEENVFDIRTPVAIAIGLCQGERRNEQPGDDCVVRYLRIDGTRADKLVRLAEIRLGDVTEAVAGDDLDVFVYRSDTNYYDWSSVTDLFPWIRSGCKLGRIWPIAESRAVLTSRWERLVKEVPRSRRELFVETRSGRKMHDTPKPLRSPEGSLRAVRELDIGDTPEGLEQYGYRSFDRHWVISDNRLADRPGPDLWRARGPRQVFLTTLTSTKLGRGPALTVTPYVPDLDHFSGRGAKNVMPLYCDGEARLPNVTDGLLAAVGERLGVEVSPEDLLAYVHALAGTGAFSERFAAELAEAAGPIHVPITADADLFGRAVALGRDLLWYHTWGERFAPAGQTDLPAGRARQVTPVEGMPKKCSYDADTETLTVGTGSFAPVSAAVWAFEVSGMGVLNSWLGYRMKTRKGKKSSPLDDIRPTRWRETDELLRLLAILDHTVEVTPTAAALLEDILANPLIAATYLPQPTEDQRKPPKP